MVVDPDALLQFIDFEINDRYLFGSRNRIVVLLVASERAND